MQYFPQFFLAITMLAFVSCKKKDKSELTVTLEFQETHCHDPWVDDVPAGAADFTGKLEVWLEAKTGKFIRKPSIKFFKDKAEFCYACSCATGNVIYVGVPAGSEQKFLDLGFTKP